MIIPRRAVPLAALVIAASLGVAAGCSDDDSPDSTQTVTVVSDADPADLEVWQTDLNAVGCYSGPVDGSLGPQTEAAIRAFQEAEGLSVDGLLGPDTEGALQDAVQAGETVCTSPPDPSGTTTAGATTSASGGDTVSVSAPSYDQMFTVTTCQLDPDASLASVQATSSALALDLDVSQGSGTLSVEGGDESDGITLNGTVDDATINAGDFSAEGTLGQPNFAGESFSVSGICS